MKRSPLKKESSVPLTKLKKKLKEDVKRLIRESGPCAMEGESTCGGYLQASHTLPEGIYKNLFIDPANIIPLCYRHHIHFWHKSPIEAATWFQTKFPDQWAYLLSMKKTHLELTPARIEKLRIAAKRGLKAYSDAYEEIKPLP